VFPPKTHDEAVAAARRLAAALAPGAADRDRAAGIATFARKWRSRR
jgi:hypothetical protein